MSHGGEGQMQKCPTCNGSGQVTVQKADEKGNSVPVQETCNSCGGNGGMNV